MVRVAQKVCRDILCRICVFASRGHIVHSCESEVRNIDALFFMLGWDWYGFLEKRIGTRYTEHVFLHRWDLRVT
jgi:hypothetical protein